MTKARIIAQYLVTTSNIVDNVLAVVKFDTSNFSNVRDYGNVSDVTITRTDDLGTLT